MVLWSESLSYCTKNNVINIMLAPGKYTVRVRGNNRMGLGTPSDEIFIKTGEKKEKEIGSPKNLKMISVTTPKNYKETTASFYSGASEKKEKEIGSPKNLKMISVTIPKNYKETTASSYSGAIPDHLPKADGRYDYDGESSYSQSRYGGANTRGAGSSKNHKVSFATESEAACVRTYSENNYGQKPATSSYVDASNERYEKIYCRANAGINSLNSQILDKKNILLKISAEIGERKKTLATVTVEDNDFGTKIIPSKILQIEMLKEELKILTDEEKKLRLELQSLDEAILKKKEDAKRTEEFLNSSMAKLERLLDDLGV